MRNHLLRATLAALLASGLAHGAAIDETSPQYKPTRGPVGSVNGVVLQQSDNAYNSIPVNSAHPLPITGSVTASMGPSSDSSAGIAPSSSTAAEGSRVLKAAAGNLYGLQVTNGAAAGYVMVFNATSAPADGAVTPVLCWAMPATNSSSTFGLMTPAYFSTGVTVVFSTTGCFTKTVSATAFFSGMVQ